MCDIISTVISQLSDEECLVFLYKVFAEFSGNEISRRTNLNLETVETESRISVDMLSDLVTRQSEVDRALLSVIREEMRKEGFYFRWANMYPEIPTAQATKTMKR